MEYMEYHRVQRVHTMEYVEHHRVSWSAQGVRSTRSSWSTGSAREYCGLPWSSWSNMDDIEFGDCVDHVEYVESVDHVECAEYVDSVECPGVPWSAEEYHGVRGSMRSSQSPRRPRSPWRT